MLSKCVYLSFLALLYVDSFFVLSTSTSAPATTAVSGTSVTSGTPRNSTSSPNITTSLFPPNFTQVTTTEDDSFVPNPTNHPERTINCYMDERFMNYVELLYTIGVRPNYEMFKIAGPGEAFNFKFFHYFDPAVSVLDYPTDDPFPVVNDPTNDPSNVTEVDNSTLLIGSNNDHVAVSLDENQFFHFLTQDTGVAHYQVDYYEYARNGLKNASFNKYQSKKYLRPSRKTYKCHFNVQKKLPVCVSIKNKEVTVAYFSRNHTYPPRKTQFSLPNYLSFDDFYSYADSKGTDFILLHHRGQWIHRLNYQEYTANQNMFLKVFHLRTPGGYYSFTRFMYADENGLVTEYRDEETDSYRYYYSLFNEVSGLKTFCIYDRFIDGNLMILGRERPEPEKSIASEFRDVMGVQKRDELEFPTMLRVLFYCTLLYLSIFLGTQLIPVRKVRMTRELRRVDKEVQRLAPVIEVIVSRVHVFMENMKQEMRE